MKSATQQKIISFFKEPNKTASTHNSSPPPSTKANHNRIVAELLEKARKVLGVQESNTGTVKKEELNFSRSHKSYSTEKKKRLWD